MSYAILTDLTRCIGCQACALACKEINELPKEDGALKLSATTWTMVEKRHDVFIRHQCFHCLEPTCVSVCPVTALEKTQEGPVIYHEDRCIGCRYCIMACPFEIPKYEWDSVLPRVQKCIMCYQKRVSLGEQPACTSVCPTGATVFGQRDQLIVQAQQRLQNHPNRYVNHIYGVHEAGGTSVLYLSDIPFDQLGFKHARSDEAYPKLTWNILSQIPSVAGVGGVMMFGLWWIINRRITLEQEQKKNNSKAPDANQKKTP
ncbi:MAG: 4Fe-4S dicluster domain-containing protein [SAR324 cluster bacterium]|nr:4Fe-4S dicluster domain-containing protein [SAR324 cluster bacterium]